MGGLVRRIARPEARGKRLFALGVLLILAVTAFPFRLVRVDGPSMEPTLHHGGLYLMDSAYFKLNGLRRNDVVVLRRGDEVWVKRLVGLPGDEIYVQYDVELDRGGLHEQVLTVQNFTVEPQGEPAQGQWGEKRKLGAGEIFVVGDNLGHSSDSATQRQDAFQLADVKGVLRHGMLSRVWDYKGRPANHYYD